MAYTTRSSSTSGRSEVDVCSGDDGLHPLTFIHTQLGMGYFHTVIIHHMTATGALDTLSPGAW